MTATYTFDVFCSLDGKQKSYCTPESYQGHTSTLYRGKGDGTFEDVTRAAGIYDPGEPSLAKRLRSYAATGLLKTGLTWREGTALYYAMNLDHFYRWPATGLIAAVQHIGVLPLMTWLTRWWEMLFPLTLVGAALTAYEAERRAGMAEVVKTGLLAGRSVW